MSMEKNFNTSVNNKISYTANDSTFALMFFKNILLIIITLGFYYPWAKTELIKYHTKATFFSNSNFKFSGNPHEVFKSYIIVFVLFFIPYTSLIISISYKNSLLQIIAVSVFYIIATILTPLIIHGLLQYRTSNTHWKGVYFKYLGDKFEFLWKYLTGIILTIFTLGIYSSWFQVDLRKYIINHLRFGNLSFEFTGNGETLFFIQLKFIFLFPLTLGIYTFWYVKELLSFYTNNIVITQNEQKLKVHLDCTLGDLFQLIIVNFLLFLFTFGLATPWIIVRNYQFLANHIVIDKNLDPNTIQQTTYQYHNNKSFWDFNLI